jgi:hypothetical protein
MSIVSVGWEKRSVQSHWCWAVYKCGAVLCICCTLLPVAVVSMLPVCGKSYGAFACIHCTTVNLPRTEHTTIQYTTVLHCHNSHVCLGRNDTTVLLLLIYLYSPLSLNAQFLSHCGTNNPRALRRQSSTSSLATHSRSHANCRSTKPG